MQPAERVYFATFTVEGSTAFPIDMLRYDHCYPASESDSVQIASSLLPERMVEPRSRRITLRQWRYERNRPPAVARWQSYRWRVVE